MTGGWSTLGKRRAGGMTPRRRGERNPGTGLKTGHYIRIESGAAVPICTSAAYNGSRVNAILAPDERPSLRLMISIYGAEENNSCK
jgi:hypothetical protein